MRFSTTFAVSLFLAATSTYAAPTPQSHAEENLTLQRRFGWNDFKAGFEKYAAPALKLIFRRGVLERDLGEEGLLSRGLVDDSIFERGLEDDDIFERGLEDGD